MLLRVRKCRLEKGLRQSEVAQRVGVATPVVSRVECGVQVPWPGLRIRLAALYAISEEDLFADIDAARVFLRQSAGERPNDHT